MRRIFLVLALACSAPASAEVTSQGPAGFATGGTVTIPAAPDRVWAALVQPERWWNSEHSWSGDASNMSLEPVVGGCFCEALPGGGSVQHMRVIYADPSRQLRLSGTLGPLQGEGLAATLTVSLVKSADGTKLAWSYKVGGYTDLPLAQIAPAVDGVVSEQFTRLASLLETGAPQAR
jgi:uncharacterized protein YndB with AHSA1/START domain